MYSLILLLDILAMAFLVIWAAKNDGELTQQENDKK